MRVWCAVLGPVVDQQNLFIWKLRQCCASFDFMAPASNVADKQMKTDALNDILSYVADGKDILTPPIYPEVSRMVYTRYVGHFC